MVHRFGSARLDSRASVCIAALAMMLAASCGDGGGPAADPGSDPAFDAVVVPDPGMADEGPADPGPSDEGGPPRDPGGDPGPAAIVAGTPVEIDPQGVVGDALDHFASWDRSDGPYLAASPCGGWGVVFREVAPPQSGQLASALMYAMPGLDGGVRREILDARDPLPLPIQFGWGLYFDASCSARVIQAHEGGYREWIREPGLDGEWARPAAISLSLAGTLGDTPLGLSHHRMGVDRDRRPHLVFTAVMPDGGRPLVHAWRGESNWVAVPIAPGGPGVEDWLGFAFGAKASELSAVRPGIHVVYRNEAGALAYQRFNDETWLAPEVVWTPSGGDEVPTAGIALGPYDVPVIAFTAEGRSEEGDLIVSELRWATVTGSTWSSIRILNRAGAYGGNQIQRTGLGPRPAIDEDGGAHVVFLDRAYFTDGTGNRFEDTGSLRYGFKGRGEWQFATLYEQAAPTQIDQDLRFAMRHGALAVSKDGTAVTVGGMVHEVDLKEGRTNFRLVAVPAHNGFAR